MCPATGQAMRRQLAPGWRHWRHRSIRAAGGVPFDQLQVAFGLRDRARRKAGRGCGRAPCRSRRSVRPRRRRSGLRARQDIGQRPAATPPPREATSRAHRRPGHECAAGRQEPARAWARDRGCEAVGAPRHEIWPASTASVGAIGMPLTPPLVSGATPRACHCPCSSRASARRAGAMPTRRRCKKGERARALPIGAPQRKRHHSSDTNLRDGRTPAHDLAE